MEKVTITLEDLISEGKELKNSIIDVPSSSGGVFVFSEYRFQDFQKFEIWKNKSLRFLSSEFKGDRCINDFEVIENKMSCRNYPTSMDKLIGVLESCEFISRIEYDKNDVVNKTPSQVINITNTQSQSQNQDISINVFIEALKEELTGSQLKEIINLSKNSSIETAKSTIIAKLKSFGGDVLSNIVANIITNPTILGQL